MMRVDTVEVIRQLTDSGVPPTNCTTTPDEQPSGELRPIENVPSLGPLTAR
jgi:hypothetical protein